MASLRVMHRAPNGDLIDVPAHVLALDTRIKNGDATCFWHGDPQMFLKFNPVKKVYQVWRLCEDNIERIICSWPTDQMDSRLLRHLASIDTRTRDVIAEIDRHNESIVRTRHNNAQAAIEGAIDYIDYLARRSYLPGYEGRFGRPLNAPKKASPK